MCETENSTATLSRITQQAERELEARADALPLQLTLEDVAGFLGVSRSSAYKLTQTQGFPAVKLPGVKRLMIPKKLFLAWYVQTLRDAGFGDEELSSVQNDPES